MTCARGSVPRCRGGFTLVEMLIAVVVGSVVVLAALQAIVTHTRLYTLHSASGEVEGNLRAAASVLTSAFLELSATDGDVIAVAADTVRIRAVTGAGLICSWRSISGNIWYGLPSMSGVFEVDDSVFAYGLDSDTWNTVAIAAADTGAAAASKIPACFYGDSTTSTAPATEVALRLNGLTDTLMVGAPLRSFEHTTFALTNRGGVAWLTRRIGSDSAQALVGPLQPDSGLVFTFYDSSGDPTTDAAAVDRVEILLRGVSSTPISGGVGHLTDSLRVIVKVRNNN